MENSPRKFLIIHYRSTLHFSKRFYFLESFQPSRVSNNFPANCKKIRTKKKNWCLKILKVKQNKKVKDRGVCALIIYSNRHYEVNYGYLLHFRGELKMTKSIECRLWHEESISESPIIAINMYVDNGSLFRSRFE